MDHVQEHIDVIARHEEEFLARRSPAERLGDSFARYIGSIPFVAMHVAFFVLWVLWNILPAERVHRFDPAPFSLLGTLLGMEAILLASFIVMRQSRMSKRADERDHLMLQLLLLTEKEVTAALGIEREIAERLGLRQIANEAEIQQLSAQTSIDDVAQAIQDGLSEAE